MLDIVFQTFCSQEVNRIWMFATLPGADSSEGILLIKNSVLPFEESA